MFNFRKSQKLADLKEVVEQKELRIQNLESNLQTQNAMNGKLIDTTSALIDTTSALLDTILALKADCERNINLLEAKFINRDVTLVKKCANEIRNVELSAVKCSDEIKSLQLGSRINASLARAGFKTVAGLQTAAHCWGLDDIKGIGKKAEAQILDALAKVGE